MIIVLTFIVLGCAVAQHSVLKLQRLQIGMGKQAVAEILGPPLGVKMVNDAEYHIYILFETQYLRKQYYVQYIEDKVVAYGRLDTLDAFGDSKTKDSIKLK